MICEPQGWNKAQIIWRDECIRAGVTELNERYNVLDAHSVLAFREGWGLPLVEAMATGAVSFAQDYCSGTEIVGDGRGVLVPPIDYFIPSTWGGALDYLPDYHAMTRQLQHLYDNPDERRVIAKRGMEWARAQTWSAATDNVVAAIERVLSGRQNVSSGIQLASVVTPAAPPQPSPDGIVKAVELVEIAS